MLKVAITILILSASVQAGSEWTASASGDLKDAYLKKNSATTNYENDSLLWAGYYFGGNDYHPIYLCLNLASNIGTGNNITACTLSVYQFDFTWNDTLAVHEILRDFIPTQVTWTIWKTSNNWTTAGAESDNNDYEATFMGSKVATANGWLKFAVDTSVANAALQGNDSLQLKLRPLRSNNCLVKLKGMEAGANTPTIKFVYEALSTSADYRHSPDGVGVRHDPSGTPTARHRP